MADNLKWITLIPLCVFLSFFINWLFVFQSYQLYNFQPNSFVHHVYVDLIGTFFGVLLVLYVIREFAPGHKMSALTLAAIVIFIVYGFKLSYYVISEGQYLHLYSIIGAFVGDVWGYLVFKEPLEILEEERDREQKRRLEQAEREYKDSFRH